MTEAKKAPAKKTAADGDVEITLAHPITREQDKRYLGLDLDKDYAPGDKIDVNRNAAQALIGSGYAAVDPEDRKAVAEVLGDLVTEPAPGSGPATA
jgi:hypothetical protein